MAKEIRYNVPSNADAAEFDSEPNYTLHADGLTVYVERIREDRTGFMFLKYDAEVAYVSNDECDVSPKAAMKHAEENPGEKIRFAD